MLDREEVKAEDEDVNMPNTSDEPAEHRVQVALEDAHKLASHAPARVVLPAYYLVVLARGEEDLREELALLGLVGKKLRARMMWYVSEKLKNENSPHCSTLHARWRRRDAGRAQEGGSWTYDHAAQALRFELTHADLRSWAHIAQKRPTTSTDVRAHAMH